MSWPDRDAQGLEPVWSWRDAAGVAHICFNRPQALNAINVPMATAFHTACRCIVEDPQVRVVVVSGEGRAFMAGGDVAAMQCDSQATAVRLIEGMHGGIRMLASLAAPVIASLHGAVAGAGLGLALACDLAIAAEGTRLNLAYPRIGASSDCATSWALPRLVGLRQAMEIALLCESIEADEAFRLGLVNRVVPLGSLAQETEAMALRLAHGPREAQARLKRLLRESLNRTLDAQLDAEAESFVASAGSADFAEGVAAFLGKRMPSFG